MLSRAQYTLVNFFHVLFDGLFDSIPVLLTFMALTFNNGEGAVGIAVALVTAASTFAGLGSLFVSKRLGFMRSICLMAFVYGMGFLLASFAGHIAIAAICFTFAVLGQIAFHNITFSYLTMHTERKTLGKVMSDFTAIGEIGRIPMVSFAAFAAAYSFFDLDGWRAVCLGYGAATIAIAVWLGLSIKKKTPPNDTSSANKRRFPSFTILRHRQLALAISASMLNAFSNDRIFAFLPLLMLAKGIDPKIIGGFALGFTVGSFLGKMACGRLADRFGSRRVFICATLILTTLLILLVLSQNVICIVILALLLGMVTKGTAPVIQTIITQPVDNPDEYDDVFSINSFLRGITNMLTPLLFGFVASIWNMNVTYVIMAVVSVLAVVPILMMQRQTREEKIA